MPTGQREIALAAANRIKSLWEAAVETAKQHEIEYEQSEEEYSE